MKACYISRSRTRGPYRRMTSPDAIKSIVIRGIEPGDRAVWEPLWKGYLDFYGKYISQETTDFTWQRLTRSDDIYGLIAVNRNHEGIGIVHFFYHPSISTIGGNCYVQDLFVSVSARKCGAGRELVLGAVKAAVSGVRPLCTGRQRSSTLLPDGYMSGSRNVLRSFDTTLSYEGAQ